MEIETTKLTTLSLGVLGVVLLPLGFIWAINTLFLLNIEYTFFNWLAAAFTQLYIQVIIKAATLHSAPKK